MKKINIIAILLFLSTAVNCFASGAYYLPDVTGEMSSASYWTKESEVLMSYEEIEKLNEEIIRS